MLLNELLKAIQPVQVTGDSRIEITGVNIDSRLVEAGQLFMAMRGTQTDGHAYIPAAIQKGATAILCEDIPEEPVAGITYIQVKDSEDAVGKIATTFYGNPTSQFELVGVTGTNGKTTIATLLYNTFRYFGYKVGRINLYCLQLYRRSADSDRTYHPRPYHAQPLVGANGGRRMQVRLYGSQFTFHRSKTYQRIKVCGRYLHESDARSSGLSQNGRELSEGKEKVL